MSTSFRRADCVPFSKKKKKNLQIVHSCQLLVIQKRSANGKHLCLKQKSSQQWGSLGGGWGRAEAWTGFLPPRSSLEGSGHGPGRQAHSASGSWVVSVSRVRPGENRGSAGSGPEKGGFMDHIQELNDCVFCVKDLNSSPAKNGRSLKTWSLTWKHPGLTQEEVGCSPWGAVLGERGQEISQQTNQEDKEEDAAKENGLA